MSFLKSIINKDTDIKVSTYKSNPDAAGVFTVVEEKRTNGTLSKKSVLSNQQSGRYTTRTVTSYASDGTTVRGSITYQINYNTSGVVISEVIIQTT